MISITRNLARQFHKAFRRALNVSTRGPGTPVTFRQDQTAWDELKSQRPVLHPVAVG